MMQTLEQGSDWAVWIEQFEREPKSGSAGVVPIHSRELHVDSWDKTDRQLHFRAAEDSRATRARWLQEHDVHTEYLDAGIGCCWFAYQGDDEPVCGETEDAAIARLARENGLPWGTGVNAGGAFAAQPRVIVNRGAASPPPTIEGEPSKRTRGSKPAKA
jgi:hypothetical protein